MAHALDQAEEHEAGKGQEDAAAGDHGGKDGKADDKHSLGTELLAQGAGGGTQDHGDDGPAGAYQTIGGSTALQILQNIDGQVVGHGLIADGNDDDDHDGNDHRGPPGGMFCGCRVVHTVSSLSSLICFRGAGYFRGVRQWIRRGIR